MADSMSGSKEDQRSRSASPPPGSNDDHSPGALEASKPEADLSGGLVGWLAVLASFLLFIMTWVSERIQYSVLLSALKCS